MTKNNFEDVLKLRGEIDFLDDEIIALIKTRAIISQEVRIIKKDLNIEELDFERENQILSKFEEELEQHGHNIAVSILSYSKKE